MWMSHSGTIGNFIHEDFIAWNCESLLFYSSQAISGLYSLVAACQLVIDKSGAVPRDPHCELVCYVT